MMRSIRAVVEYTGLSMKEALELPCDMFMLCVKNHTVDKLMETDAGREYLEDCERLKQTRMDKKGLSALMNTLNGGEDHGGIKFAEAEH